MAMVRTMFSPRCCATSSTRRRPSLLGFQCVQNRRQVAFELHVDDRAHDLGDLADQVLCHGSLLLTCLQPGFACPGARRYIASLADMISISSRGDRGLTGAVVDQGQVVDHLAGIARRIVHRGHARALFAGLVLEHRPEDLHGDVARQQGLQDFLLVGLVLVARPAAGRLRPDRRPPTRRRGSTAGP